MVFETQSGTASLAQVKEAIDQAARAKGFSCKAVSWEDAQRYSTGGGGVSCVGPNIADVRLYERGDRLLYTLRSDNWNERLGYVSSADVMLMTGNEKGSNTLETVSLADYLRHVDVFGAYAGMQATSLFAPGVDEMFSIRFQAVFLPVGGLPPSLGADLPKTEFCTEVYSYNTHSKMDPRNLLLLATPQGTSMQEDTPQKQRLFYHTRTGGVTQQFWLEAEQSTHVVGGEQREAPEAAQAAAARGKAVAVRIGPTALGTRFNVQMLIQVPLQQRTTTHFHQYSSYGCLGATSTTAAKLDGFGVAQSAALLQSAPTKSMMCARSKSAGRGRGGFLNLFPSSASSPPTGISNAARVSRGSLAGVFDGLPNQSPSRDERQHGTITVTLYYTVVGGVPTVEDVTRCTADLDALYKAMPSDKRLSQCIEVTAPLQQPAFSPAKPYEFNFVPPPVPGNLSRDLAPASSAPEIVSPPDVLRAHAEALAKKGEFHCPQYHALRPACGFGDAAQCHTTIEYFCDVCGAIAGSTTASPFGPVRNLTGYGCRACDYDLCSRCYHRSAPAVTHVVALVPYTGGRGRAYATCSCTTCSQRMTLSGLVFVPPAMVSVDPDVLAKTSSAVCFHCYINWQSTLARTTS